MCLGFKDVSFSASGSAFKFEPRNGTLEPEPGNLRPPV